MKGFWIAMGIGLALGAWHLAASEDGLEGMVVPEYTEEGELIRPEGYRNWTFVGASLGLSYSEESGVGDPEAGPGNFHNVYIQPEAYRYYQENGVFPEKTMLPSESYFSGTRSPESNLTAGYFEGQFRSLSVAVKDRERYPEGWGYVSFRNPDGGLKATAQARPKARCYDCHLEHGENDNVFTQFYPMLRRD